MIVVAEVSAAGPDRPPVGTTLVVQVRDVSLQDAAAEVLGEVSTEVRGELGTWLNTVELAIATSTPGQTAAIWAHADVTDDGVVTTGDFITMESFPVPAGEDVRVAVTVKQVR